tara:strand:- start:4412 stop:5374 length:963 start_codon:yes stop_codon:yes gene_type:complete
MSLNKHFATHNIQCSGKETFHGIRLNEVVEVASSLIHEVPPVGENTVLCFQACPTELGKGDVSSNLRFKEDTEKNNIACQRWLDILQKAGQGSLGGIYSTTLSRDDRLRMYTLNDDGSIDVYNKEKDELPEEKETLKRFLENFGMDAERVKVMKGASEYGATYMADLLSFVMVLEVMYNEASYASQWFIPEIVKAGDERLKPVQKGDKVWTPVEGNDYLYFKPSEEGTGVNIQTFVGDPVKLYKRLQDLLTLEENEEKADLRKMFSFCKSYTRSSDVWINDLDDPLAIYMILNAYSHTELNENELSIKAQLEAITSTFFQ